MKDTTPPPKPADPLPPREPLQKPTRDDGSSLSAPAAPPKAPEVKKAELHLPKSKLPASYFDSNGHARPYSLLDPMNMTDSFNNDQFHYRN